MNTLTARPSSRAFDEARAAFVAKLSQDDRAVLDWATCSEDILSDLKELDRRHQQESLLRRFMTKISPCIQGFKQYAKVMDVMVNAKPEVLSVLWGAMRILLRLAQDFLDIYKELVDMLEDMGRLLCTLDEYPELYPKSERLHRSLLESYKAYLSFCLKCYEILRDAHNRRSRWYRSSTTTLVAKAIWKPVKTDFRSSIAKLKQALDNVKDEANLAEKQNAAAQALHTEHRELFEWLDAVDPDANLQRALGVRESGTGEWMFSTPQFEKWVSTDGSVLWMHGKPGAGKTIMSSTVIAKLQAQAPNAEDTVLYYFCDYKDSKTQTAQKVIQSLIAGLCRQYDDNLETMTSVSKQHRERKTVRSTSQLVNVFLKCLAARKRTFLVIDGLDECDDRSSVFNMLLEIPRQADNVRLLLCSREEPDIKAIMGGLPSLPLDSGNLTNDINKFVRNGVRRLINSEKLKLRQSSLEEEIINTLSSKSNGMFQWVKCQFDALLSPCMSDKSIRTCLKNIPVGLDETYVRIFERLRRNRRSDSELVMIKRIFTWLVYSLRPLTLSELAEAISIEPNQRERDLDAILTDPKDLLDLTGGLVVITDGHETIGLSHFSVKEFLLSDRFSRSSVSGILGDTNSSHSLIANACLTYLMMDDFAKRRVETVRRLRKLVTKYPLWPYAARFWFEHYRAIFCQPAEILDTTIEDFLCDKNFAKQFTLMLRFDHVSGFSQSSDDIKHMPKLIDVTNPIYYAAYFGLESILVRLLKCGHDIDALGENFRCPILAASFGKHRNWKLVDKMVDLGANIHVTCDEGNLAHAIAYYGSPEEWGLLKRLVERRIAFDRGVKSSATNVLQWIATRGKMEITRLLLAKSADPNVRAAAWRNAWSEAVGRQHWEVVKTHVDQNANVNGQFNKMEDLGKLRGERIQRQPPPYERPMNFGIREANEIHVAELAERGPFFNEDEAQCVAHDDPLEKERKRHTLCQAIATGNESITNLLISKGAQLDVERLCQILTALEANNVRQIQRLLQERAYEVSEPFFEKMLLSCKKEKSQRVVLNLIDAQFPGFKIQSPGDMMFRAIRADGDAFLGWLLARGIDPNTVIKDPDSSVNLEDTALSEAIKNNDTSKVELLLAKRADVNLANSHWNIPLYVAFENDDKLLVERLLSLGANPHAIVGEGRSFIHEVAFRGCIDMMDTLFDAKIDTIACSLLSGSSLAHAVGNENLPMIKYLFHEGADLQEQNYLGQPLLEWAEQEKLDDACSELRGLGATKHCDRQSAELQIQDSVANLCQVLLAGEDLPGFALERHPWLMLGQCLWSGNDPTNSLIALEQWIRENSEGQSSECQHCELTTERELYLCQRSTQHPFCEKGCLKTHKAALHENSELETHKHLKFPRPFFFAIEVPCGHVAVTESEIVPAEAWLKGLEGWKCKPEIPSTAIEAT